MNAPMNYEERIAIMDQKELTIEDLKKFEEKGYLETFDCFKVPFDEEWKSFWYLIYGGKGEWLLAQENRLIPLDLVAFEGKTIHKNLDAPFINHYQAFIKRHGQLKYNNLSKEDKIDVLIGEYETKQINDTLNGLINLFKNDVNPTLKEIKESE